MTTTFALPTETHLPPDVMKHADFETWKEQGGNLVYSFKKAQNAVETGQWDIGDWLIQGEKFGKKAYGEAERITGWQRGTLQNVVWVTKKFPISLRSETKLKWSHFKELAKIEDDGVREELLQQFNDGFEHTVLDVRSRVDAVLIKLKKKKGSANEKPPKTFVYLQVSLKPDLRDLVKSYARAEGKHPDVLLREIVTAYFKKNKPVIEAAIQRKNPHSSKSQ
jgi:hypothetical protein